MQQKKYGNIVGRIALVFSGTRRLRYYGLTSFVVLCCLLTGSIQADPPAHFGEAKRLAKRIYADHRLTFYCGCRYDKHNQINLRSCGYKVQKNLKRASRLEWEHLMPVSLWGKDFPCWKNAICCKGKSQCYKGRRCCREVDKNFSKIEADLHNLVPEMGELNGLRSNYRFGLLPHIELGQFGDCEIKIDSETRRVEPRPAARGLIARAYLYMSKTYKIHLSDSQLQLMRAWNALYPPDAWEIEWDKRVASMQGNHNLYISEYAQLSQDQQNQPKQDPKDSQPSQDPQDTLASQSGPTNE
jgi:deoxyribonuclease-1